MRHVQPGGTGHDGADHGSSFMPGLSEMAVPSALEAPPPDHHLEEVLEALSRLAAAEAEPEIGACR